MFGTDILVAFFFCNLCGVEHDRLGAGGKGQKASPVVAADGHEAAVVGEGPLDNLPQFRKVHLQGLQGLGGIARIFADKSQKKVFHRNAVASQVTGRHTGRLEDRLCLCRKNTVILRHIVNYEFGVRNSELDFLDNIIFFRVNSYFILPNSDLLNDATVHHDPAFGETRQFFVVGHDEEGLIELFVQLANQLV